MTSELYNINDYTDNELYSILDLNDPTDRELEAKILSMINKYDSINSNDSERLKNFFENMYNHFFIEEEEEIVEEIDYTDENIKEILEEKKKRDAEDSIRKTQETYRLKKGKDVNKINTGEENIMTTYDDNYLTNEEKEILEDIRNNPNHYNPTKRRIAQNENLINASEDVTIQNREIGYTKPLNYVAGNLNPILKQTVKRIISIDSQYRTDKRTLTTEFTCNLSEPLRDVVSLKLYSIQIPYTWYTIPNSYGSNFIYIKGNVPGINNELHDVMIDISSGNYLPTELNTTINESIEKQKSTYLDVSFGDTNLEYNRFTSLCKFTVDLNKLYNENSYKLEFTNWSSPYGSDETRITNIAGYLGFEQNEYELNTLTSFSYDKVDNLTYNIRTTDASNNYLKIIKYHNSSRSHEQRYNADSTIDNELLIKMTLVDGAYTREEIMNDLNTQIHNNQYLTNECGISRNPLYVGNKDQEYMTDLSYNKQEFTKLKIKPDRYATFFHEYDKIYLELPNDTDVWIGQNSCFQFENYQNEINNIVGKYPVVEQTDKYYIHTSPYMEFICETTNFNNTSVNDFSFNIMNSYIFNNKTIEEDITDGGYSLNKYIKQINQSMQDISKNLLDNKLIDLNLSNINENFSELNIPNETCFYINNELINFNLKFVKTFTESHYYMDVEDSIFGYGSNKIKRTFTDSSLNETTEQNTILNNLSGEINNSNDLASNAQFTINNGDKIITIYPKSNNVDNLIGNENDISHNIFFNNFTTGDYFLVDISTNIQDAFNNYIDPITNENIFQGTTVSIINKNLPDQDNEIEIKMNIKLNKTLRPRDYSIKFVDNIVDNGDGTYTNDNGDTLNNLSEKRTWKEYLKIDDSMIDNPYDLSAGDINVTTILNNDTNVQVGILDNERNVLINAINILDPRNLINIVSGVNDTIKIIGVENGVYSSGGENDIILTLNSNEYNKVTLIDEINRVIQNYNNTNENITFEGKIYIIQKEFTIDDETKLRDVVKIDLTVTRRYFANDYKVVFYDNTSFVTCYVGVSSVRNTTWDSTLGWVLGYRLFTIYDLSVLGSSKGTAVTIDGDTGVSTNLYNYFLLCLDDYNQNHLNDGLVTISNNDTTIPLPSYVNRTDFQCDPITGEKIYNIDSNLTDKQLYAANQIANMTTNQTTIGTSVSAKSYGTGPYVKDVFGLIPIKSSGLLSGDSYVEFGGTLQNQERSYFGPVNVQRLTIRLMTDRGDVVDLNNANWSFSLICEQLNKTTNNE